MPVPVPVPMPMPMPTWPPPPAGTWVIDLDGVIWLTGQPIAGVDIAVTALRAAQN